MRKTSGDEGLATCDLTGSKCFAKSMESRANNSKDMTGGECLEACQLTDYSLMLQFQKPFDQAEVQLYGDMVGRLALHRLNVNFLSSSQNDSLGYRGHRELA